MSLYMLRKKLENAGRSDRGLVREANEDCVAVFPESGLVVVADGMGGARAGEIASHMAVDTIAASLLSWTRSLSGQDADDYRGLARNALAEANRLVFRASRENPEFQGMGTTVVLGLFLDRQLVYAHVGDSRLYRLRGRRLECLTVDHSVIQELVDQGVFASLAEARAAGVKNNVLTRVLGIDETVSSDLGATELLPGDIYLFCTDGLTNMVDDEMLIRLIKHNEIDLGLAADSLVATACAAGGKDNVSLVLVRS